MSGVLLVLSRCTDPAREEAWRSWYDRVHLPHVLENGTPGLDSAQRYENPKPGKDNVRSAAVYELSQEPTEVFDRMHEQMKRRREEGSTYTIDCLEVVSIQTYRKLSRVEV